MAKSTNRLTAIELDVLEAVARGMQNQQIALQQHRSLETIRTHVTNILRKLRARNRTHAVAIAYHVGLFRGHPDATTRTHADVRHPLLPPRQH